MTCRFLRRETALPHLLVMLALIGCVLYAGYTDESLSDMIDHEGRSAKVAADGAGAGRCTPGNPTPIIGA